MVGRFRRFHLPGALPFRFEPTSDSLTPEFRRLAAERLAHGRAALDNYPDRPEALHDVRRDIKKIRGLLRLVRPAFADFKPEDRALRDAARAVSRLRDDTAMLECLARFEATYGAGLNSDALAELRRGFEAHRDAAAAADGHAAAMILRDALVGLQDRARHWALEGQGFDALSGGFRRTLSEARHDMRAACETGTERAFHDWRKHLKYHWYHAVLLQPIKPGRIARRIALASDLAESLGNHHDLAALRHRLRDDPPEPAPPPEFGATLDALARAEMARLERATLAKAQKLLSRSPKKEGKRWHAWWRDAAEP